MSTLEVHYKKYLKLKKDNREIRILITERRPRVIAIGCYLQENERLKHK